MATPITKKGKKNERISTFEGLESLEVPAPEVTTADKPDSEVSNIETLTSRYLHFMDSGAYSDITLIIGKEKVAIKAHKVILIFGSSYFEELLDKEFKANCEDVNGVGDNKCQTEKDNATVTATIVVEDVDVDEFRLFLKFLYCGIYPTNVEEALPLLHYATRFRVPSLALEAGNLLKTSLSVESAPLLLQQALKFQDKNLEESALNFICRNAYKILSTENMTRLSSEALELAFKRDDLRAFNEMQVFEAAISWAKSECVRQKMNAGNHKYVRSVLEPVLKYIRFPQMNASEFSLKVARLQVLNCDEVVDILPYFHVRHDKRSTLPSAYFVSVPRHYYIPETREQFVRRWMAAAVQPASNPYDYDYNYGYNAPQPTAQEFTPFSDFKLKANKTIWISSLGLAPNVLSGAQAAVKAKFEIKDVDDEDDSYYTKHESMVTVPGNNQTTYVRFKKPVKIIHDAWYSVSAAIHCIPGTYHQRVGQYDKKHIVACGSGADSFTFEFDNSDDGVTPQIPEIGYQLED